MEFRREAASGDAAHRVQRQLWLLTLDRGAYLCVVYGTLSSMTQFTGVFLKVPLPYAPAKGEVSQASGFCRLTWYASIPVSPLRLLGRRLSNQRLLAPARIKRGTADQGKPARVLSRARRKSRSNDRCSPRSVLARVPPRCMVTSTWKRSPSFARITIRMSACRPMPCSWVGDQLRKHGPAGIHPRLFRRDRPRRHPD